MAYNQNNIGRTNSASYNSMQSTDFQRANSNLSQQPTPGNTSVPSRLQRPGEGNRLQDSQNNGYQNSRPNDRDVRGSANTGYNNPPRDPFDSLIDEIRTKNVLTLNQFFSPFDAYRGRILK